MSTDHFPEAAKRLHEYLINLTDAERSEYTRRLNLAYSLISATCDALECIAENANSRDRIGRKIEVVVYLAPAAVVLLHWISNLFFDTRGYPLVILLVGWASMLAILRWNLDRADAAAEVVSRRALLQLFSQQGESAGVKAHYVRRLGEWTRQNNPDLPAQQRWDDARRCKHEIAGEKLYLEMKCDLASAVGRGSLFVTDLLEVPTKTPSQPSTGLSR